MTKVQFRAQNFLREIEHRQALAGALRMPEHAEPAPCLGDAVDGGNRSVDA
jgi:hypothetical protein